MHSRIQIVYQATMVCHICSSLGLSEVGSKVYSGPSGNVAS